MSETAESLTQEALGLNEAERAQLAQTLLESLDAEGASAHEVERVWDEEVARRLQRVLAGTAQGIPADEVMREMKARFSR